jgi:hypothetical protein
MAYARFSRNSDVYVYQDTRGGYTCECTPTGTPVFNCATASAMVAHLRDHRARGHQVPDEAIEELLEEHEDE